MEFIRILIHLSYNSAFSKSLDAEKPVAIEAIQLTDDNHSEIIQWLSSYNVESYTLKSTDPSGLYIKTLEGVMKANIGDYIIKGVKDEFYPCREDIFKMTYDEYN